MPDAYDHVRDRLAAKTRELTISVITLTRNTHAAPDEETPWIPGTATTAVYTLDGVVKGVAEDYVDGTTVVASDLMVIASPVARLDDTDVLLTPHMDDVLTIDGADRVIKKIQPMPAAGPPARIDIVFGS